MKSNFRKDALQYLKEADSFLKKFLKEEYDEFDYSEEMGTEEDRIPLEGYEEDYIDTDYEDEEYYEDIESLDEIEDELESIDYDEDLDEYSDDYEYVTEAKKSSDDEEDEDEEKELDEMDDKELSSLKKKKKKKAKEEMDEESLSLEDLFSADEDKESDEEEEDKESDEEDEEDEEEDEESDEEDSEEESDEEDEEEDEESDEKDSALGDLDKLFSSEEDEVEEKDSESAELDELLNPSTDNVEVKSKKKKKNKALKESKEFDLDSFVPDDFTVFDMSTKMYSKKKAFKVKRKSKGRKILKEQGAFGEPYLFRHLEGPITKYLPDLGNLNLDDEKIKSFIQRYANLSFEKGYFLDPNKLL
jgi:hypothetical protein